MMKQKTIIVSTIRMKEIFELLIMLSNIGVKHTLSR